jgi:hypothetical protein
MAAAHIQPGDPLRKESEKGEWLWLWTLQAAINDQLRPISTLCLIKSVFVEIANLARFTLLLEVSQTDSLTLPDTMPDAIAMFRGLERAIRGTEESIQESVARGLSLISQSPLHAVTIR